MKYIIASTAAFAAGTNAIAVWGQCGGQNWTGSGTCDAGSTCVYSNPYYSQCLPNSSTMKTTTSPKPTTTPTPTTTPSTKPTTTPTTSPTKTSPTSSPTSTPTKGKLMYGGVNIAGFDFGCTTDGTCTVSAAYPPFLPYGLDGLGQMKHFVTDDGFNAFRLPTSWQYLVNGQLGGPLNATNLATYDKLVQGCIDAGAAFCLVDIHNYARWNGAIIGQGGPTNAQFASFWAALAAHYAGNSKVAFGLMNEPHDLDVPTWAGTVQAAVTAIRNAGANNLILMPGTGYTSAGTLISSGSAAALAAVSNPDGSKTGLIFDVHKYLDSDNSGTNPDCVTNNIDSAFAPLAAWLRQNNRQAMLTETGGGYNSASCITYLSQQLNYLAANSDVYLGFTSWAAGNFQTTYTLSETPTNNGGVWTDQPLVAKAIVPAWKGTSS